MRILSIIILIIIIAGGYYLYKNGGKVPGTIETNGNMLSTGTSTEILGQNVSYFPGANGYFVRPTEEGTYPGVVVIHENRGLRPEIKTMADELAKSGYLVLAVDLFGGKVVETQDEARAITATFNQETGTANMHAAAEYLRSRGATKVASLGWCFGGAQSLQLALFGEDLAATVIYYGRLSTSTAQLGKIDHPVLGIFGDKDQSITVQSVNQFEEALDGLGIENEIHIYEGVGHAFANPSGMNYAPEQTKDAWQKTVAFLKKHLSADTN